MKTSFTTKQWRAIRWYFDTYRLLPRMSAYPHVSFEHKETGEIGQKHINFITQLYEQKEKANA